MGAIGHLSTRGVNFIIYDEGWTGIQNSDYKQPAIAKNEGDGCNTVGPGVTHGVVLGKSYTFQQICAMFAQEIIELSNYIDKICPQALSMGENVVDAIISLAYNCGSGYILGCKNCPNGMKGIKSAQDVANVISKAPTTSKGKVLRGLVRRRGEEKQIALGIQDDITKVYYGEISQKAQDMINAVGGIVDLSAAIGAGGSAGVAGGMVQQAPPNAPRPIMASRGANTVYKLAEVSNNKNIEPVNKDRKEKFAEMQKSFSDTAPELGRDIILTGELYRTEILKGQDAKSYRDSKNTGK